MASRGLRSTSSLLESAWRSSSSSSAALPRVASGRRYLSSETSAAQTSTSSEIPHATFKPRRIRAENAPYNAVHPTSAPAAMRKRTAYPVNDNVEKLNKVIERLVGPDVQLPQELKWQIVTHKSFDHGRQPFNQKLALFGETIVQFHAAQRVLNRAPKQKVPKPSTYEGANGDIYAAPEVFEHADYKNLGAINKALIEDYTRKTEVSDIVLKSGLVNVTRWKPAQTADTHVQMAEFAVGKDSLMALVGALALNKGADVAAKFVTEKILAEMKFTK